MISIKKIDNPFYAEERNHQWKWFSRLLIKTVKVAGFKCYLPGISINKLVKIINGNRKKKGYRLALWNCGRGLLQNYGSGKLDEIRQFIESKHPHCFGIVESDLFGTNSQFNRRKYTSDEILEKLKIDGYKLELPATWSKHGQARIICYVSEEIKYTRLNLNDGNDHIPTITLSIGSGKANSAAVHYYYREWKNGVTGETNHASQLRCLQQHLSQVEKLIQEGHQVVTLGDANVCALHWNDPNFQLKSLANEIQSFLLSKSCFQLVDQYTRIQNVSGNLQYSCLDHVTTNIPEKCNVPEVFPSLSSDHLPVMVTKFSHEVRTQPKTIKKRLYKNFSPVNFLLDAYQCMIRY